MFREFKVLVLSVLAVLMFAAVPVHAAVGIQENGLDIGTATEINFVSPDGVVHDGDKVTVAVVGEDMVAAGVADGGATSMTSTTDAIPVGYSYVRMALNTTVGQVKTLANGKDGQIIVIHVTAIAGSGTAVITPTTKTGFVSLTLNAVDDEAILLYVDDTTGWVNLPGTSVTVNH